jgi:hypothetical protein
MSTELDHIQLSPLIVGEWYKDALLLSPDGPPAIQNPPPQNTPPPQPAVSQLAPATPATQPAPPPKNTPPSPKAPQPAAEHTATAREPAPQQTPRLTPDPAPQPAAEQASAPEAPVAYKYLGKNGKKITILVQSPGIPFLPDNQLTFLTKILEACRMNIGDVAIVNTATAPVTIAALRQQLQPASVLLFGLEPTAIKLPINFPEFKVQPYDNCSYLSAPPLTKLVQQSEESKLLKSKLWVCLKTLFNV